VLHLKKYLCKKLNLGRASDVCHPLRREQARGQRLTGRARPPRGMCGWDGVQLDILCNGEILGQEHSLEFIKRTRWSGKTDQLVLHYRPTIERY